MIGRRRKAILGYESYLKQTEPYFNATKKAFPHLIREITALARAVSIPLPEIFFLNNLEVYNLYDSAQNNGHCTIAVSFNGNGAVVGHNEDWHISSQDNLYILKATIGDVSFLGLQYLGVPGDSAMVNNWGLVQCINDLSGKVQRGIPKNFIARAVLECRSLDEAEHLIRSHACASGFNHVLVQNNEVRNIEVSGNKIGLECVFKKPYVHTNHFLTAEMAGEKEMDIPSSQARYRRAKELVKNNMNVQDMIRLLSDSEDVNFPICRPQETIGSALLLPKQQKAFFCYGHPCQNQYFEYSLT